MYRMQILVYSDYFFTCKFVTVKRDFEESNLCKACKNGQKKNALNMSTK